MNNRIVRTCLLSALVAAGAQAQDAGKAARTDAVADAKSRAPADFLSGRTPEFNRREINELMSGSDPVADWMSTRIGPPKYLRDPDGDASRNAGEADIFGHVEWRDQGGVRGLIQEYDAMGERLKSSLFGDDLSRKLEVKVDGSPEIKYRLEFD